MPSLFFGRVSVVLGALICLLSLPAPAKENSSSTETQILIEVLPPAPAKGRKTRRSQVTNARSANAQATNSPSLEVRDRDDKAQSELSIGVHEVTGRISVRPKNGARYIILRAGNPEPHPASGWFYVQPLPSRMAIYYRGIFDFIPWGGRSKGGAALHSPSPASKVWPERFVARWHYIPRGKQVALILSEAESGNEIWRKENLDGGHGEYSSPKLRQLLQRWREENHAGESLTMQLQVKGSALAPEGVDFKVLSSTDEGQLKSDLIWWRQNTTGTIQLLGQAKTYYEAGLFFDAATQYQAASNQTPSSSYLRKLAAQAWRVTGKPD